MLCRPATCNRTIAESLKVEMVLLWKSDIQRRNGKETRLPAKRSTRLSGPSALLSPQMAPADPEARRTPTTVSGCSDARATSETNFSAHSAARLRLPSKCSTLVAGPAELISSWLNVQIAAVRMIFGADSRNHHTCCPIMNRKQLDDDSAQMHLVYIPPSSFALLFPQRRITAHPCHRTP